MPNTIARTRQLGLVRQMTFSAGKGDSGQLGVPNQVGVIRYVPLNGVYENGYYTADLWRLDPLDLIVMSRPESVLIGPAVAALPDMRVIRARHNWSATPADGLGSTYVAGDRVTLASSINKDCYGCIQTHAAAADKEPNTVGGAAYWRFMPFANTGTLDQWQGTYIPRMFTSWAMVQSYVCDGAGGGFSFMGIGPATPANPTGWRLPTVMEALAMTQFPDGNTATVPEEFTNFRTMLWGTGFVATCDVFASDPDTTYSYLVAQGGAMVGAGQALVILDNIGDPTGLTPSGVGAFPVRSLR
jgi:hypothetical protein